MALTPGEIVEVEGIISDWWLDHLKIVKHRRGDFATMPTLLDGEIFYAKDLNEHWSGDDVDGPHIVSNITQDIYANIPAAGAEDRMFYATDEGIGYLDDSTDWLPIFQLPYLYTDDVSNVFYGLGVAGAGNATVGGSAGNTAVGAESLYNLTTGSSNSVLGYQAGYTITGQANNTLIGHNAGRETVSSGNTFIGSIAGSRIAGAGGFNVSVGVSALRGIVGSTAYSNVAVGSYAGSQVDAAFNDTLLGYQAGYSIVSHSDNVFVGYRSGYLCASSYNACVGSEAGYNVATIGVIAIGYRSGYLATNSPGLVSIGYQAGRTISTGMYDTFVGYEAGYSLTTSSHCTFIGYYAGRLSNGGADNTALGSYAGYGLTTGGDNVCIGYRAGYSIAADGYNVMVGSDAGRLSTTSYSIIIGRTAGEDLTADGAVIIGYQAAKDATTPVSLVAIGYQAGFSLITGDYNTFVGYRAGYSQNGSGESTFIGCEAGYSFVAGDTSQNVFVGYRAGYLGTAGDWNTYIGWKAGYSNNGTNNVIIGNSAATLATGASINVIIGYNTASTLTTGDGNIIIGGMCDGVLTTGSYNILIGYNIDASALGVTYELNIGNYFVGSMISGHELVYNYGDLVSPTMFTHDRLLFSEKWSVNGNNNLTGDLGLWSITNRAGAWVPGVAIPVGYYYGWQGSGGGATWLTSPNINLQNKRSFDHGTGVSEFMTDTRILVKFYLACKSFETDSYTYHVSLEVYDGTNWCEVYKHTSGSDATEEWIKGTADISQFINRTGNTQIRIGCWSATAGYIAVGRVYIVETEASKQDMPDERFYVYNGEDETLTDGVNYNADCAFVAQADKYDTHNYSVPSANWQITIKTPGTYLFICQFATAYANSGDIGLCLVSSGGAFIALDEKVSVAGKVTYLKVMVITECGRGDIIKPRYKNATGGNGTLSSSDHRSYFCGHRLSWSRASNL